MNLGGSKGKKGAKGDKGDRGTDGGIINPIIFDKPILTNAGEWHEVFKSGGACPLSDGSYVVTIKVSTYPQGGGFYFTLFSGVLAWFNGNTNSNNDNEVNLHACGQKDLGKILKLKSKGYDTYSALELQTNETLNAQSNFHFEFTKIHDITGWNN
jgi:hypothetical protein